MSVTYAARIEHVHHTTSRATVRCHTFLVDRTVSRGGLDLGPAGGEYMLVALGGCFSSHVISRRPVRERPFSGASAWT